MTSHGAESPVSENSGGTTNCLAFAFQQGLLARHAPAIAGQSPIAADHTMAWHRQGDRVRRTGSRHRPNCLGVLYQPCQLRHRCASRPTEFKYAQRAPDALLEDGAPKIEWQVERLFRLLRNDSTARTTSCNPLSSAAIRARGKRRRKSLISASSGSAKPRKQTPLSVAPISSRPKGQSAEAVRMSSPSPPRRAAPGVMPRRAPVFSYTRLSEPNPASATASATRVPLAKAVCKRRARTPSAYPRGRFTPSYGRAAEQVVRRKWKREDILSEWRGRPSEGTSSLAASMRCARIAYHRLGDTRGRSPFGSQRLQARRARGFWPRSDVRKNRGRSWRSGRGDGPQVGRQ